MVNTTDSIGGKKVVPLTQVPEGTAAPRYRAPKEEDNRYTVTSRLFEEDLVSEDAEVLHVLPAQGWRACFEGGRTEPLVCWAVLEDDRAYGVALVNGKLNVSTSVENRPGWTGYIREDG